MTETINFKTAPDRIARYSDVLPVVKLDISKKLELITRETWLDVLMRGFAITGANAYPTELFSELILREAMTPATLLAFLSDTETLSGDERDVFLAVFKQFQNSKHKTHFTRKDVPQLVLRGMGVQCESNPDKDLHTPVQWVNYVQGEVTKCVCLEDGYRRQFNHLDFLSFYSINT